VPRRDVVAVASTVAIGVAIAALALRVGLELGAFAARALELPLWDEAKYGLAGARLAEALAKLDLVRFVALVYDLDVWPPLFPLTESLVFLAAGNSFAVARLMVVVMFSGLVVATFWSARELAPGSPAVAAIAPALVASSPFVQLFAVQAMLEIPGALLYVLCLSAYLRHLRTGTRGTLVATGVLSAALFFTKYNYGLLWLAPLFVNEAWLACGGFRAMGERAVAAARRIHWRRPFTLFVALYLIALAAILVTGGGALPIGERDVSVTSIGNPLYGLIVIVLVRAAWGWRRSWERFKAWERALGRRPRVLFWTAVVPAATWLLLPPHLRSFVDFVENRSDGPSLASTAGWLFHPRVFAEQFHPDARFGWIVAVVAIMALTRIGRVATSVRILLLAVLANVAALTLHPYKEPRFLLIAAPVLWIAAAWNAVTLIEIALARARLTRVVSPAMLNGALALMALGLALTRPAASPSLRDSFASHTVPASTVPLVERVLELTEERPTIVLGTWNQLSPALIEWRFLQRAASGRPGVEPELVTPSRRGNAAAGQIARRLRDDTAPVQVILFDADPANAPSPEWAAAFRSENAWLEPVRAELDAGTTPYGQAVESFGSDGYRVRVFKLARAAIPASGPAG
jgi:hypothetical protein